MANNNGKPRREYSARLVWDTKPRRAPNPKDIEFQTAEVVLPNPKVAGEPPSSFREGGDWKDAATAILTEATLVDQPLKTELEYRVIAINKAGDGSPSNTVMVVL